MALVQQANNSAAGTTSLVVTLGAAPIAGDSLFLVVASGNDFIASVTQTNVTWVKQDETGINEVNSLWDAINIGAGAGTTITIGINLASDACAIATEFNSIQTTGQPDVAASTGTYPNTGPATTNSITNVLATALFLASATDNSNTTYGAPSNGFTALTSPAGQATASIAMAYKLVTAVAAQSTSWTVTGNSGDHKIISYKGIAAAALATGIKKQFISRHAGPVGIALRGVAGKPYRPTTVVPGRRRTWIVN